MWIITYFVIYYYKYTQIYFMKLKFIKMYAHKHNMWCHFQMRKK
jgi:hypothetical protein